MSEARVQTVVEQAGRRAAALPPAAVAIMPGETLVVAMDGCQAPQRDGWHEVKVANLYSNEKRLKKRVSGRGKLLQKGYLATLAPAVGFGRELWHLARAWGVDQARRVVCMGDGAPWIWNLAAEHFPGAIEIVDFYHACDHLKKGCDAAWGESTQESKDYFDRLKTCLKETDDGAERVIRTLRFQGSLANGNKRKRLEAELTYFRNQQSRMHYPEYLRLNLPIASGVMEAACKTLVTQRLKRSGMAWTHAGGQAILTLRSLIQSNRWRSAWTLLSADFRKIVNVPNQPNQRKVKIINSDPTQPITLSGSTQPVGPFEYASLPLAG
jgi:hypothetical protein